MNWYEIAFYIYGAVVFTICLVTFIKDVMKGGDKDEQEQQASKKSE